MTAQTEMTVETAAAFARGIADLIIAETDRFAGATGLHVPRDAWKAMYELVELRRIEHAVSVVDLYAPTPGQSVTGAPKASRLAALEIAPKTGSLRRKVLNEVMARRDGLMTDEMIERAMNMKHQTVSARRNELVKGGWLEDSGRLARNTSGSRATLWQATSKARHLLREEAVNGTSTQG